MLAVEEEQVLGVEGCEYEQYSPGEKVELELKSEKGQIHHASCDKN